MRQSAAPLEVEEDDGEGKYSSILRLLSSQLEFFSFILFLFYPMLFLYVFEPLTRD